MIEAIFKPGDHIVPKDYYRGIDRATVSSVDNNNYYLKIMNGSAIIPISAQQYYKLDESV